MKRFFSSFQVQIYFVLALLALLLFISAYVNAQVLQELEALGSIEEDVNSSQLTSVYLLSSLARRYLNAEDPDLRESLSTTILATIENVNRVQEDMLAHPLVAGNVILNDLVRASGDRWDEYVVLLNAVVSPSLDGALEADALIEQIDRDSVIVSTYTTRVVTGLGIRLDDRRVFANGLVYVAIATTTLFLIITVFVVARSVRAVARLASTALQFGSGDFSVKADTSTFTEIADVGTVFNKMVGDLGKMIVRFEEKATEADIARQQAERSDLVKSAFLAAMSHELRTPLNSVINFSKLLQKGMMGSVNEKQVETLGKVVGSGQHLLSLINDVLDISKIQSNGLSLFVEDNLSLRDLLEIAVANIRPLLENRPVELSVSIPEGFPVIRGDKKRLMQVFLNLLTNAAKFVEEGSIWVVAEERENEVEIRVTDTGPGIADGDRELVFEAFKQTAIGLKSGEGTGLGLPIAKSLVEAHGGRMWFESVRGEGTTFYVILPVKSELFSTMSLVEVVNVR